MPCFVLSTFSIAPPPTPTTAKQRNKGKERKTGLTFERKKVVNRARIKQTS